MFKNLNEHEKCIKNSNRIVKNVNKKKRKKRKKKYTINHRKAVNDMKKFRLNLQRKGKHVAICVTKSKIVAVLNKI